MGRPRARAREAERHYLVELELPEVRAVTRALARAWAMAGDSGKARAAYEELLQLWKDADAAIPVVKTHARSTPG